MTDQARPLYRDPGTYFHLLSLIAILAMITWLGLWSEFESTTAWFLTLVLLAAFAVISGHAITGLWRGILIDGRYKMSLSRLQMLAWTLLILSALLSAVMRNLATGWETPLDIYIPSGLWVLMGISTASLVASPTILVNKARRTAPETERVKADEALKAQGYTDLDTDSTSIIVRNLGPRGARWGDLLKGEEVNNAAVVDLGKLQMFFFTFILVLAYSAAIFRLFAEAGEIAALPEIQEGMNVLLGISHTGYLANKAAPRSLEEPVNSGTGDSP